MKKLFIVIFIISQAFVLYSKLASVNVRFLLMTHPDFKKFDFSGGMFNEFEDLLNKNREEFARFEKLYLLLSEQKSQLKQKLEKSLRKAGKDKWTQPRLKKLQEKFDNTFSRLNRKLRAIEKKLDEFRLMEHRNFNEKAWKANQEKFYALQDEIIQKSRAYALKHGYSGLINTSVWRKNINYFNQKFKLYPTMKNSYGQFFKKKDKASLDNWFSEGVMICSKKMMYNSDFILYGGDDITFRIFYSLRSKSK